MVSKKGDLSAGPVVAVDAMGGDTAPGVPVEGAVLAARQFNISTVLVGDEEVVRAELERLDANSLPIRIVHAPEVAGANEPARVALRGKPTSIRVAFDLVTSGEAQAIFSAGNTGAALAVSMMTAGRMEGVDRPAVAAALPGLRGDLVLLDAGANAECKPLNLIQFALMGAVFAREVLEIPKPRVGLLSNGVEETKGTESTRQAHELLKNSTLEYVGFIEGNEIMSGRADVVVTDGFSGNMVLKSIEGVAEFLVESLSDIFTGGALNRLGLALLRDRIRQFGRRIDYTEYGGAPLLGVNSTCIIGHGRSTPKAASNAIRLAAQFEVRGYRQALVEELKQNEIAPKAAEGAS